MQKWLNSSLMRPRFDQDIHSTYFNFLKDINENKPCLMSCSKADYLLNSK